MKHGAENRVIFDHENLHRTKVVMKPQWRANEVTRNLNVVSINRALAQAGVSAVSRR
jgi:hypothetical protein